jgi:hypothetical protein
MPIALRVPVRRLSQREFGEIAFEVMRHVFAIHKEIRRFFDETITGLNGPLAPFEEHARRLLAHSDLRAIAWVNVNMNEVTFTTLER